MKRFLRYLPLAILALGGAAATVSCSDDVNDDSYYTFTGDTVASYCSTSENYSTFAALLDDTGLNALLATYGHYTCFLPDNAAFNRYFSSIGKSYSELTIDEKREIVFNHVIKSAATDYSSCLLYTSPSPRH